MILINTASTNVANVTVVNEELGVEAKNIIDASLYKKKRDVFDLKKSVHNANRPLRLLSIIHESEDEKAAILHALELDVLIDLSGYTQNGEQPVLAQRPSVIQANYLGFPGQMSVPWIDFNQQDFMVSPPHFSKHYEDKLVYLPYYYACNHHHKVPDLHPYQRPGGAAYLRNVFKVPTEGHLFCFPNQLYKLTADLLDTWANILRRFPSSYLWLLRHPIEGEENIKLELQARGIFAKRVLFSDFENDKIYYMVRTSICDVILDSPLWSAGATGLDAYWSGVPIIGLAGDRTVERLGISLMVEAAAGCKE